MIIKAVKMVNFEPIEREDFKRCMEILDSIIIELNDYEISTLELNNIPGLATVNISELEETVEILGRLSSAEEAKAY